MMKESFNEEVVLVLNMKNRRGKENIFPVKVIMSKTRVIKAYKVSKKLCQHGWTFDKASRWSQEVIFDFQMPALSYHAFEVCQVSVSGLQMGFKVGKQHGLNDHAVFNITGRDGQRQELRKTRKIQAEMNKTLLTQPLSWWWVPLTNPCHQSHVQYTQ